MALIKNNPCNAKILGSSNDAAGVEDSWYGQQSYEGADVSIVTDVPGSDSCYRIRCRKGYPYPGSTVTHRTEVYTRRNLGAERWIGNRYYFPEDYVNDATEEVILQVHQLGGSPSVALETINGNLRAQRRSGSSPSSPTRVQHNLGSLPKGRWFSVVVHYKLHPTDGILEIWIDDVKLVNQHGIALGFTSVDPLDYYPKIGLYKWHYTNSPEETASNERIFYIDDFKFGDENSSYEEVRPTPPPVEKFTVTTDHTTGGTVSGAGEYEDGETANLVATPTNEHWVFEKWTEDGEDPSTANPLSFTVEGDRNIKAVFAKKKYALTVTSTTGGTATGGGLFEWEITTPLTASINSGYQFSGWYRGDTFLSNANPYSYTTRKQSDTVQARFVLVPVSVPTADVTTGTEPLTVQFDCDWSGTGATYLWDFQDGNTSTLKNPEHTFSAGTYEVECTVTVGELSATETITITVAEAVNIPPIVTIISPTNLSASFIAPAEIPITVAVHDPEGEISKVEFFANGDKIGESIEAPYSFIWHDVPVGTYYIQARAYDDVQHTDSLPVAVSVYDPLAGYILNGKHLSEYGIIPAQAPDSNIALTGAWDMPARIGKTYHEWPDEHNIEPYLLPEEIFFAGRDLRFYGLLQAESDQEARDKIYELYSDIDKSTSVVPFSPEWGSWEIHVLDQVKAENIGNGWYTIELPMRQPVVVMDATIPDPTGSGFGIDGFTWGELGLILMETQDPDNRPEVRQAETTFYGREEVGVKKRGLKEFKLRFVLREDTYEVFNNRIKVLQAIFSSPGARTFRLEDGSYREVFIKDGFTVSQIMVCDGEVSAVLEITVTQIRQLKTWNLLTDNFGKVLTDGRGRPLTDILKWI